jgi:hypothetical protein
MIDEKLLIRVIANFFEGVFSLIASLLFLLANTLALIVNIKKGMK